MADIEKINPTEIVSAELLGDLRKIIDSARSHVAATANYELTAMYWHIGDRINRDVLNNERAEYNHPANDAIRPAIPRFSNCVTTGVKIVMDSFSDSYAD